jgi:hypothetical protein
MFSALHLIFFKGSSITPLNKTECNIKINFYLLKMVSKNSFQKTLRFKDSICLSTAKWLILKIWASWLFEIWVSFSINDKISFCLLLNWIAPPI